MQNYFEIHAYMYKLWPGQAQYMYDHFDLYLTPVTLTFNLPKKCFKWHFSSSRATTVPNRFEIHELLYKLWSGQIRTYAWTHGHTHIHRTKIVRTMSRLHASRLYKNSGNKNSKTTCTSSYHRKKIYIISNERNERCRRSCRDKIMVSKV